jgi:hypothetical protein
VTGIDELTEEQLGFYSDALIALRAALPSYPFIHSVPVKNPSGVLYEARAYDREGGRLLADVAIRSDGVLAPVRLGRVSAAP